MRIKTIGSGRILRMDGERVYFGTMPFETGAKVAMVLLEDLVAIAKTEKSALLTLSHEMPEEFFDVSQEDEFCVDCCRLPDEIIYDFNLKGEGKLFLDRRFYSHNPRDYLFVRWRSVNQEERDEK